MDFSQRIKQLRKEHNLRQEDLAKKISKTRSAVAGWETEGKEPDHETLTILSNVFGVSIDYLIGKENNKEQVLGMWGKVKDAEEKYAPVDDIEEAMKVILEQPGLMLKGSILSDESKIILANAIQMGLRTAEELEKKKGDNND